VSDTRETEELNRAKGGHYQMEVCPECEGAGVPRAAAMLGEPCLLCDGGGQVWFDKRTDKWETAKKDPTKIYNAAALTKQLLINGE